METFEFAPSSFGAVAAIAAVPALLCGVAVVAYFVDLPSFVRAGSMGAGAGVSTGQRRFWGGSVRAWLVAVVFAFTLGLAGDHVAALRSGAMTIERDELTIAAHTVIRFPLDRMLGAKAFGARFAPNANHWPIETLHGVRLPNFWSGWFRLQNGIHAYVHVTDPDKVLVVPTRDNYAIVVSPADSHAFLGALVAAD